MPRIISWWMQSLETDWCNYERFDWVCKNSVYGRFHCTILLHLFSFVCVLLFVLVSVHVAQCVWNKDTALNSRDIGCRWLVCCCPAVCKPARP